MAYLESFDSKQLRNMLGTFTTGVTIVTTRGADGTDYGVTANSFSSVSLEPPLILWSQAYTSKSFAAFRDSHHFAVNILADDQVTLSNHFAKSKDDKFAEVNFHRGLGGVPVLAGTVAHFECTKEAAHPAGDHVIFIGRVERVSHSGRRPLAFAFGQYMVPYAHGLGPVDLRQRTAPHASAETLRQAVRALPEVCSLTEEYLISLSVWGNHGPTVIHAASGEWHTEEALPGTVLSVTQTAAGRAFASFLPEEVTQTFVAEDLRLHRVADEDQATQIENFKSEVTAARKHGLARAVAASNGRNGKPGNAFSAPVFDLEGHMIYALCVSGDTERLPPDWNGSVPQGLLQSARLLSRGPRGVSGAQVAR